MADAAPAALYLPELPPVGAVFAPPDDEAHYLSRVVRARPGERVEATDGRGERRVLEVIRSRPDVELRVLSARTAPRALVRELWCGAPEGDRADWLIEKLGELGVAVLQPIDCERASWERFAARRERFERLATAALRQSLGSWRLEIREPQPLAAAIAAAGEGARFAALPGAARAAAADVPPTGHVTGVVGPSPGFSEGELKRLSEGGFRAVGLAEERLRTETAALALAAFWAVAAGA